MDMSVWKIGSRWDSNGNKNCSVLSIFRRNNIVFVGNQGGEFCRCVKAGDYFAIEDGTKVVAVAKALTDGKYLSEFVGELERYTEKEKRIFDFEKCKDWTEGCKVRLYDLDDKTTFTYQQPKAFWSASGISKDVISLYENQNKDFSIISSTYTLLNSKKSQNQIFKSNVSYVIPIYQRPYSWGENQIDLFLNSIFQGYWGDGESILDEPIFIGTMQLSEKKAVERNTYEQEIIDGQQRLSTILIFLKVLTFLYPNFNFPFDLSAFLETRVNFPEQQNYLSDFLKKKDLCELYDDTLNIYERNALYILGKFQTILEEQKDLFQKEIFTIESFYNYLTTQVLFVVIETHAGLSKTLQIFNTINTAGLDLNSGDLFKLRFYEYLKTIKSADESVFKDISNLYEKIDELNRINKLNLSINRALKIYKDFLVTKYNLSRSIFHLSTASFYDRLFDTLLGVKQWEGFGKKEICLDINELNNFIELMFAWEISDYHPDKEAAFSFSLIVEKSRYSSYWYVCYQLFNKYQRDFSKVYSVISELNKLFFIYSIYYAKAINDIHSFMYKLEVNLNRDNFSCEALIQSIRNKINSWEKGNIKKILSGYIIDNRKKKDLICMLDTYLYEEKLNIDDVLIKLFKINFDIEHIHATADNSQKVDKILQNGIGNLTLLEYQINRSIGNKPFNEKQKEYKNSKYLFIQELSNMDKWDEADIIKRRDLAVERIINYLFQ